MYGRAANCTKDHVTRLVPRTGPEESEIHATFTEEWQRISLSRRCATRASPDVTSEINSSRLEREGGDGTYCFHMVRLWNSFIFSLSAMQYIPLAPQSRGNRISNEQTMNNDDGIEIERGRVSWKRNARNRQRAAFVSQCLPWTDDLIAKAVAALKSRTRDKEKEQSGGGGLRLPRSDAGRKVGKKKQKASRARTIPVPLSFNARQRATKEETGVRDKSPLEGSIVVEHKAPTAHIDEKIERRLSVVVTNGLECLLFRYRANDALYVIAELHVLIIFRGRRKEDHDREREGGGEEEKGVAWTEMPTKEEETGRARVLLLQPPSFSIGHVISTRSILPFLRTVEISRTYIGYVTSARLFVLGHTLNRDMVTYRNILGIKSRWRDLSSVLIVLI